MKKLLFGLIATVMFSSFSFGQDFESFIKPELYGTYHNEVLKVYTEKHKGEKTLNFISLYDNLKNEMDILHPNELTNEENTFYKNRIVSILGEDGNLNSSNYHELTMIGIKKYYSSKTQLILLDLLENPKAPVEVDKLLNSLLTNNEVPASEINEIKKLISVFNASIEFWNVPMQDDSSQSKKKCNPKHQQYLADICGCMFGGVGAIAYSWLIEEMQQQHGGGCI